VIKTSDEEGEKTRPSASRGPAARVLAGPVGHATGSGTPSSRGAFEPMGPHDFAMIGSVTRADTPMKRQRRLGTAATRPRGLAVFRQLAQSAGFGVARVVERPFSDHVLLRKDNFPATRPSPRGIVPGL
jgi:hypothetical protein